MRHALPVLLVVASVGCSGGTGGDPDASSCDPGFGTLEVCVFSDSTSTSPSPGAEVTGRRSETDVPFLMPAPEGCSREQVEVGTWQVSGNDSSGTCPTPFEPVEVRECETTTHRVEYINSCVDGML
ncbi:MAG: hypothetical protein H6719_13050 [Sandaracinaceae bacterium]|nr:hypothetical protein [Sandaracinaceae bacterium]